MVWKTSVLVISKILEVFGNTLTSDHMYSRHRWEKSPQQVQTLISQKRKRFSENFIAFLKSAQYFGHFERKDLLHSINILEIIDHEKCSYFNVRNLLFYKTLLERTCSRVTNTGKTYTAAPLSYFSINLKEIDLENISFSHIENLRTVW